jgi:hypothetical protein
MNKNNLPVQLTIALSSNSLADCDIEPKFIISINDLKFHELLGTGEFACMKNVFTDILKYQKKLFKVP